MVLTQIVKESTLSNIRKPTDSDFDARAAARQSEIAWNLCTAIFYKVGGRPWKVADIRDGVCYVGLVFQEGRNHRHVEKCLLRGADVSRFRRWSGFQGSARSLVQRRDGRFSFEL